MSLQTEPAARRGAPLPAAVLLALALALAGCTTTKDQQAEKAAASQSSQGSQSYEALMRVAETTRQQGDLATAGTLYRRAHAANQAKAEPLVALGGVLTDLGSPREALEAWRMALARDPANSEALRGYGRALLALDQPEEAARQYASVLARDPADRRALNGLGVAKDRTGDHKGAQAQYRTALAGAPDDTVTRNNLGFSLILSRDYAAAIEVLEPLALEPRATARERQNLALAYGLAGREADAARIGRLDLDEAGVQQNLAYYREARSGRPMPPGVAPTPPAVPLAAPRQPVETAPVQMAPVQAARAPAPAVPAPPAPASSAPAEGLRVNLGAYATEALAQQNWQALVQRHPSLMAGRELDIARTERRSDGRAFFIVRTAGFAGPAEAAAFCNAVRSRVQECAVVTPKG